MTGVRATTRRNFLRTSGLGAVGLIAARSSARVPGANGRIHCGVVVCDGGDTSLLRDLVDRADRVGDLDVCAACDLSGPGHDYRDLLARDDLDAVLIAAPDRRQARITLDALHAGKHVYCERPVAQTWKQAGAVAEAAEKTGLVVRFGCRRTSLGQYWTGRELIARGVLGKVLGARVMCSGEATGGMWSDRLYDKLAPLMFSLGPEFPVRVSAAAGVYADTDRGLPDTFFMTIDYPPGYSVVLVSSTRGREAVPDTVYGCEAAMCFHGRYVEVRPEKEFRASFQREHGAGVLRVAAKEVGDHMDNFIKAVRGEENCRCDAFLGYTVVTAISLGLRSLKENRLVDFDPGTRSTAVIALG